MPPTDAAPDSRSSTFAEGSAVVAKRPASKTSPLIWLSLAPVIVVVALWLYSGYTDYSHNFSRGQHGITVRSDMGVVQIIRWTRLGPPSLMSGEITQNERYFAGLGYRDTATNDGVSSKKIVSIPFWLILVIVAILPMLTVKRAQNRLKRASAMLSPTTP